MENIKKHTFKDASQDLYSYLETIAQIGIPGAVNSLPLIYLKEITQVLVNSATNWISEELAESIVGLTFSDLATASTLTAKLGASIDYMSL